MKLVSFNTDLGITFFSRVFPCLIPVSIFVLGITINVHIVISSYEIYNSIGLHGSYNDTPLDI